MTHDPHDEHARNYDLDTTRITNPTKAKPIMDPCKQEEALHRLSKVSDRHDQDINQTHIEVAEMRKDIQTTLATCNRVEAALQAAVAAIASATALATSARAEVAAAASASTFKAWDKVRESAIFWLVPIVLSGGYWLVKIVESAQHAAPVVK